jgi:hypothetical protein
MFQTHLYICATHIRTTQGVGRSSKSLLKRCHGVCVGREVVERASVKKLDKLATFCRVTSTEC